MHYGKPGVLPHTESDIYPGNSHSGKVTSYPIPDVSNQRITYTVLKGLFFSEPVSAIAFDVSVLGLFLLCPKSRQISEELLTSQKYVLHRKRGGALIRACALITSCLTLRSLYPILRVVQTDSGLIYYIHKPNTFPNPLISVYHILPPSITTLLSNLMPKLHPFCVSLLVKATLWCGSGYIYPRFYFTLGTLVVSMMVPYFSMPGILHISL